jgi:amidase
MPPSLAELPLHGNPLSYWVFTNSCSEPSKEVIEFSPNTALYNMTGQPSMSVPLHWTPDGLPVGVMFSARFGEDATLFQLGAQLQAAQPWASPKPKL